MTNNVPERPNFEKIEANASSSAAHRTEVLTLIGTLSFSWSNNESMFIYVLMILLEISQTEAMIIFGTLNTTRARLDLVQRLAKIKLNNKSIFERLQKAIKKFNICTRIRNDFNHALYTVDENGDITQTHSMKISETPTGLKLGVTRAMDSKRETEMCKTIQELKDLNRELWDLLPLLRKHLVVNIEGDKGTM